MNADPHPTDRCTTSQPISWLALERHALGELPPAEANAIADHLRHCPACQTCAARITTDSERLRLPDLPPLPAIPPLRSRAVPSAERPKWWRWSIGATAGAALAVAAVMLLVGRLPGDGPRPRSTNVKGMAVGLTLVRERDGAIAEDPPGFLPSDRWQALVTCPAGPPLDWALLLFQNSAPAQRIAGGTALVCGNRVPLPGAFRLTESGRASICFLAVTGADDIPPGHAADLEHSGAACVRLVGERR
jgi:Putative zinc-finger